MKYSFCIITQPRSGDELLISKLRSHPNVYITLGKPYVEFTEQNTFTSFYEYLEKYKFQQQNYDIKYNEQDIVHTLNTREYMEQYYKDQIKIGSIPESQADEISAYLDLLYSKDKEERKKGCDVATQLTLSRYKNYGMTLYGKDLLTTNCFSDILSTSTKYIILFRRNLLWQYVSTLLPITINEHGYTKIIDTKITISKKEFEEFIFKILSEREKIKEYIIKTNQQYIEIYYEDLARNSRNTLDRVQEFLNVPVQEQDLYGINPDNIYEETRPLEVIVTNYKDVKADFADSDTLEYFKMAEDAVNPFYYEIRKAGTFKSLEFLRDMSLGKP
jgi:hypothetical protein